MVLAYKIKWLFFLNINFCHIMLLIKIKLIVMSIVFFYLKYFGGSWNRLYLFRWVVEWKSWNPWCRGPNNCFLKCPSASSSHAHMEAPSSCKESVQRIMGARSVHQFYPSKSFILKGPLKWPVLNTSVWNDPSIWRLWLFSLRSTLRRVIYVLFGTHC